MVHNPYHIEFLRPIEPGDVEHVANNIREADRLELQASLGKTLTIKSMINMSKVMTPDPATITHPSGSGEPVAIIGTVPPTLLGTGRARPWMMGTDKIFERPRAFVEGGRGYVKDMLERYGALENFVDARNAVSKAWLRCIGFKLEDAKPYGVEGLPFHRFHVERYT